MTTSPLDNAGPADPDPRQTPTPRYRFGFVLVTTIGNMTRYVTLRKYAERDPEVDAEWVPVTHHIEESFGRRWRALPVGVAMRLWLLAQLRPHLRRLVRCEAVMLHLFEAETVGAAWRLFAERPLLIGSADDAPIVDRSRYPLYPKDAAKPVWRQRLRLGYDRWRLRRFEALIPFTRWAADILVHGCGVPARKVSPIHVGVDLELWRPRPRVDDGRFRLLFVGSDFVRKGGDLLLRVFAERFVGRAELHLVTPHAPAVLPPDTHVHVGLPPQSSRLVELYAMCDVLVMPTTADLVPWAFLEAMAMERAAIGTAVGAIAEVVTHGVTGTIVPAGDADALAAAIQEFLEDPERCRAFGRAGRSRIERDFDAAVNVPRILAVMKAVVDERRH